MAGDDDHHHADREDEDVAVLNDQVRDVLGPQQDAVRRDREEHDHRDEGDEDAVLTEVGQDVAEPAGESVVGRVGQLSAGGLKRRPLNFPEMMRINTVVAGVTVVSGSLHSRCRDCTRNSY